MKRKIGLMGLLVLVLISLSACATIGTIGTGPLKTDAPLPPATIIQPSPAIEWRLAAFSGAWFGRWDDQMDHILVVERIESPEKITAIYSFGSGFGFNPGWVRVTGRFVENELQFQLRPGRTATYQILSGSGDTGERLMAVYQSNGARSETRMKRVNLKDLK